MNAQINEFWDLNRMYVGLRDELMEALDDQDLAFTPGGSNPTLGELCRELGDTQCAYAESFKTFKVDFSYRSNDDRYVTSVAALQAWFKELDAELEANLQAVADEDVANRQMDRGGYAVPVHISLDIFREALLIFYGKVSVYAKVMGKPLTQTWSDWIA